MDQWEQSPVGTTLGAMAGQLSSRPITDDMFYALLLILLMWCRLWTIAMDDPGRHQSVMQLSYADMAGR